MANILIGVTGGISAYKIASVVSILHDKGHNVRVIMTESAKKFVTPLTFSSLSHNPVFDDEKEFSSDGHITHIELAEWADIFIIAPATANTISKIKNKYADNLLTSTVLAYTRRLLIFPAMNFNMWRKIRAEMDTVSDSYLPLIDIDSFNVNRFGSTGIIYIQPETGKMACGSIGEGKLPNTKVIISVIERILKSYFTNL